MFCNIGLAAGSSMGERWFRKGRSNGCWGCITTAELQCPAKAPRSCHSQCPEQLHFLKDQKAQIIAGLPWPFSRWDRKPQDSFQENVSCQNPKKVLITIWLHQVESPPKSYCSWIVSLGNWSKIYEHEFA